MNKLKIKEQRKIVTLILLISAGLFLSFSFFTSDKEQKVIILIIGAALLSGVFIARLFKGSFGYKPTLDEIEVKQFGKK